ncbi:hypothetical protein GF415_04755 [Candidatus Micrarchaeota archaeon]|nr:hypothetical protein [Candidatus Micrarchaeota archaeon]
MNQSKGFVSMDLLFSAIPILLMLTHALIMVWISAEATSNSLEAGEITGKLATIADYVVKRGAVERSFQGMEFMGTASYRPNVIDGEKLSRMDLEETGRWVGLDHLQVSFEKGEGNCIYRLVLLEGEIKKLYVCGE